jgi:electron transport protein HydN
MAKEFGLFVSADPGKCVGCKACEVACFQTHHIKKNRVGRTVGTVTVPVTPKLYVTATEHFSLPIQCKHCENAPCKAACQQKAIIRQNGQVVVDEAKCIGCKDCLMACPFGAVSLLPYFLNGVQVPQADAAEGKVAASKCDLCFEDTAGPACVRACPHEALRLTDVDEERKKKNIAAAEALAVVTADLAEGRLL